MSAGVATQTSNCSSAIHKSPKKILRANPLSLEESDVTVTDESPGKGFKKQTSTRRKPSKRNRKWKPYSKLTWEEKRALDEKEKIKAVEKRRGEMLNNGRPIAPYNTTQFIMDEHDTFTGTCPSMTSNFQGSYHYNPSDSLEQQDSAEGNELHDANEFCNSPQLPAAPDFVSQDFAESYERAHEETLYSMSKTDLVEEHLGLEKTLRYIEDQIADVRKINEAYLLSSNVEPDIDEQLQQLRKEYSILLQQNNISSSNPSQTASTSKNNSSDLESLDPEYSVFRNRSGSGYVSSDLEYEVPLSKNSSYSCIS